MTGHQQLRNQTNVGLDLGMTASLVSEPTAALIAEHTAYWRRVNSIQYKMMLESCVYFVRFHPVPLASRP